jgi:N-acetyl-anhydromuramyl-L-alanine amidase AmpD
MKEKKAMNINKLITKTNYQQGNGKQNKYIVIHYVGATGGAQDNCKYFLSNYRGASAHYFIGHVGEIWQCVEDKDIAWHCGSNTYKHPYCRNSNSIGIEMCCRQKANGTWYFEDATVKATIELVKKLMKKYSIPAENVIRHYDVTGKICPEPYVRDVAAWNEFKKKIVEVNKQLDNTPDAYAKDAIEWAIKNGVLKGTETGDYKLHSNITRQDVLVFLHRALK